MTQYPGPRHSFPHSTHVSPAAKALMKTIPVSIREEGILATILGIMYKDSLVKDFKEFKKNYLKYLVISTPRTALFNDY